MYTNSDHIVSVYMYTLHYTVYTPTVTTQYQYTCTCTLHYIYTTQYHNEVVLVYNKCVTKKSLYSTR